MKKLLRKPLCQFVLITIGIFIAHGFSNKNSLPPTSETITIDNSTLVRLSGSFEMKWKRKPSRDELFGLLDQYTRQELIRIGHKILRDYQHGGEATGKNYNNKQLQDKNNPAAEMDTKDRDGRMAKNIQQESGNER